MEGHGETLTDRPLQHLADRVVLAVVVQHHEPSLDLFDVSSLVAAGVGGQEWVPPVTEPLGEHLERVHRVSIDLLRAHDGIGDSTLCDIEIRHLSTPSLRDQCATDQPPAARYPPWSVQRGRRQTVVVLRDVSARVPGAVLSGPGRSTPAAEEPPRRWWWPRRARC